MLIKCKKQKITAQSIVEFSISFILVAFVSFFIVEIAVYLQNLYAVQTCTDEINANLVLHNDINVCKDADNAILDLINPKVQRYLDKELSLNFVKKSAGALNLESNKTSFGKKDLKIEIICNDSDDVFLTRSTYLYKGLFIFKTGREISSISSVQSPKF